MGKDLSLKQCSISEKEKQLSLKKKRCKSLGLEEDDDCEIGGRVVSSCDTDDDLQKNWNLIRCCDSNSDLSLKSCKENLSDESGSIAENKITISSLPDELLSLILARLSTKDAARMSVLLRRFTRGFSWITNIDLDDSPIDHCLEHPHLIERFAVFKSFVDYVLQPACEAQHLSLSRFRLHFGGNLKSKFFQRQHKCKEPCLPDLEPLHVHAWIGFPLSHNGLKELDLCIHVRGPGQLPPAVFTLETLEVLDVGGELKDLPNFHNVKYPEMGYDMYVKWDNVLLGILNRTPRLKILSFPKGLTSRDKIEEEVVQLERQCWTRTQAIPSCFRLYVKKIVIDDYGGAGERELDLVKFLLRNTFVLEELSISRKSELSILQRSFMPEWMTLVVDQISLKNTLMMLPKASITCSIQVQ